MKKYYVCQVLERIGDIEHTERFLVVSAPGTLDARLESLSKCWRGECKFDEAYGGYWFDGNLYYPAEMIAEVTVAEFNILSRFMTIL